MGIESVGGQGQQVSQQMNVTAMPSSEQAAQVQKLATEIAPLISSMSNLCVQETQRTEEGEKTHETTDAPRLDEAELEAIAANCVDLEALIAELQAETDEKMVMVSKERIEGLQGQLSAAHEDSMAKLNESLDALRDQYKTNQISKALGWLGVAVAALGVVSAVLTGGATATLFAVASLALATSMQVMNETGAMDDLVQGLSDALHELDKNNNISSEMEDALASLIISLTMLVLTVGAGVGSRVTKKPGGGLLGKLNNKVTNDIDLGKKGFGASARANLASGLTAVAAFSDAAVMVAGPLMSVAGLGSGIASAVTNFNASMSQADVKEMEAVLKRLQTLLDEESEDLQQILQSMNDSLAAVIELLGSKQDALNAISMNIGA